MLAADVTCNPVDALAPGLRVGVVLSNNADQPSGIGIRLDAESVKGDALQQLLSPRAS